MIDSMIQFVDQYGYLIFFLALCLGPFGIPIPNEIFFNFGFYIKPLITALDSKTMLLILLIVTSISAYKLRKIRSKPLTPSLYKSINK